jgi:hypothetical protein
VESDSLAQREIDTDGIVRKDHAPAFGAVQHAGQEQSWHVAMHGFHIAVNPAGNLADGHFTVPPSLLARCPISWL